MTEDHKIFSIGTPTQDELVMIPFHNALIQLSLEPIWSQATSKLIQNKQPRDWVIHL